MTDRAPENSEQFTRDNEKTTRLIGQLTKQAAREVILMSGSGTDADIKSKLKQWLLGASVSSSRWVFSGSVTPESVDELLSEATLQDSINNGIRDHKLFYENKRRDTYSALETLIDTHEVTPSQNLSSKIQDLSFDQASECINSAYGLKTTALRWWVTLTPKKITQNMFLIDGASNEVKSALNSLVLSVQKGRSPSNKELTLVSSYLRDNDPAILKSFYAWVFPIVTLGQVFSVMKSAWWSEGSIDTFRAEKFLATVDDSDKDWRLAQWMVDISHSPASASDVSKICDLSWIAVEDFYTAMLLWGWTQAIADKISDITKTSREVSRMKIKNQLSQEWLNESDLSSLWQLAEKLWNEQLLKLWGDQKNVVNIVAWGKNHYYHFDYIWEGFWGQAWDLTMTLVWDGEWKVRKDGYSHDSFWFDEIYTKVKSGEWSIQSVTWADEFYGRSDVAEADIAVWANLAGLSDAIGWSPKLSQSTTWNLITPTTWETQYISAGEGENREVFKLESYDPITGSVLVWNENIPIYQIIDHADKFTTVDFDGSVDRFLSLAGKSFLGLKHKEKKLTWWKQNVDVQILEAKDNDKSIQIKSIDNDGAVISVGKFTEWKLDKAKWKLDHTFAGSEYTKVELHDLASYIQKNQLNPRILPKKVAIQEEEDQKESIKKQTGFFGTLFGGGVRLGSLVAGPKKTLEALQNAHNLEINQQGTLLTRWLGQSLGLDRFEFFTAITDSARSSVEERMNFIKDKIISGEMTAGLKSKMIRKYAEKHMGNPMSPEFIGSFLAAIELKGSWLYPKAALGDMRKPINEYFWLNAFEKNGRKWSADNIHLHQSYQKLTRDENKVVWEMDVIFDVFPEKYALHPLFWSTFTKSNFWVPSEAVEKTMNNEETAAEKRGKEQKLESARGSIFEREEAAGFVNIKSVIEGKEGSADEIMEFFILIILSGRYQEMEWKLRTKILESVNTKYQFIPGLLMNTPNADTILKDGLRDMLSAWTFRSLEDACSGTWNKDEADHQEKWGKFWSSHGKEVTDTLTCNGNSKLYWEGRWVGRLLEIVKGVQQDEDLSADAIDKDQVINNNRSAFSWADPSRLIMHIDNWYIQWTTNNPKYFPTIATFKAYMKKMIEAKNQKPWWDEFYKELAEIFIARQIRDLSGKEWQELQEPNVRNWLYHAWLLADPSITDKNQVTIGAWIIRWIPDDVSSWWSAHEVQDHVSGRVHTVTPGRVSSEDMPQGLNSRSGRSTNPNSRMPDYDDSDVALSS